MPNFLPQENELSTREIMLSAKTWEYFLQVYMTLENTNANIDVGKRV
jgi:hypothetical protein